MSLPGKLCIGILEEDNPLKAYFRFKPLLVERDGSYQPYEDDGSYGDEGCIRIVPDKNEAYHFKSRMRRMGLFCVVDLRGHPEENDKIRPNKNYRPEGPEINSCIIYSDVVREPARDMIFEILRAEPDAQLSPPRTPSVLLRGESVFPERYAWEAVPGEEERARLVPTGESCPPDSVQVFELKGFKGDTVSFAIVPAGRLESVIAQPRPEPHPESAPAPIPHPAEEKPAEVRPEPRPEPKPQPQPQEKPWLQNAPSQDAQPHEDGRLSVRQRMLAAQTGLNPRRGRSLQELVDEKWQRSRLSQLANAASDLPTGAPVPSPVDSAVRAVREAWAQPGLRDELLSRLGGIEEFGASLQECREVVRQKDIELRLDAMEERRLAMLRELDQLNQNSVELRRRLKDEIRREEASSLAEAVQKTEDARREQQKYEALAAEAKAAAQDARKAVDDLATGELERRLRDFALNQHMVERMELIRDEAEPLPEEAPAVTLSPGEIIDRVIARFEAEGCAIDRLQAANLTVCLGISPNLLLSGPVGCGKTQTARLLGEALGLTEADRFVAVPAGINVEDALFDADISDGPGMVLLDDANTARPDRAAWGLTGSVAQGRRVILTLQDSHSGHTVPARVLDRGFLVRLAPLPDAPWQPRKAMFREAESLVDIEASFRDLPASPEIAVPASCAEGMAVLCRVLTRYGASLSRRALDESWRYCAIMHELLGDEARVEELLDLAVAQRILPALLAGAPLPVLKKLPEALRGLHHSLSLLDHPLPIRI